MPLLDLRDVRLVHAVAARGGLAAASKALHLTQSALSHHLRSLEQRLGVSVFDRVGRNVVLNARGARLVALADRLLPELLTVEKELVAPAAPAPRLRLTTGCYTAYPWLPTALARMREHVPSTRIDVRVDATRRASEALVNGEVDLAVMPWLEPDPRLVARHVFDEEFAVAMRPDDPLALRAAVPIELLAERRVLTHEVPAAELAWIRATFGKSASALRHAERLPLTEAIVSLTKAGEGVSLLGAWTLQDELAAGTLVVRPLRPALSRPFAVVTVRHRPADPRADVLAEVLREWASEQRVRAAELEGARRGPLRRGRAARAAARRAPRGPAR
ncbi:MAG: LysR family transcriptional regulator [Sandaracinus sp.]